MASPLLPGTPRTGSPAGSVGSPAPSSVVQYAIPPPSVASSGGGGGLVGPAPRGRPPNAALTVAATGPNDYKPQMQTQMTQMLHAMGDDEPNQDTAQLLELIVLDYVSELSSKAAKLNSVRGGKIKLDDVLYVLKRDPPKHARATELLIKVKEIEQARKTVDYKAYGKGGASIDEAFKGGEGRDDKGLENLDVDRDMEDDMDDGM